MKLSLGDLAIYKWLQRKDRKKRILEYKSKKSLKMYS